MYAGRRGLGPDMQAVDLGLGIWWWQTAVILVALWSIRASRCASSVSLLKPRFSLLWIYVGFLIFNCLCPYIGLKTRSTLTMHCNLRTERGYWNHLFLPARMRVFGYQDDLVEIVGSNLPDFAHLRAEGMPLPFLNSDAGAILHRTIFTSSIDVSKVPYNGSRNGRAGDRIRN